MNQHTQAARTMLRAMPVTSEMSLHIFTAQLLKLYATGPWWHVPNGGYRSKRTGARLKLMGVRAGVADFHMVLRGGQSAFLELKAASGRLSVEQKAFRDDVLRRNALHAVCDNPESVAQTLFAWGALTENPLSALSLPERKVA